MSAWALCAGMVLSGCRCGDGVEALAPDLVVAPASVDVGAVEVNAPTTIELTLANPGTGTLHVSASIEPADEGFVIGDAPAEVRAGDRELLHVVFTPPSEEAFAATLVLTTNSELTPRAEVALAGSGGPASLLVTPNPLDFGRVNEGPGATQPVELRNDGLNVLTITDLRLADGRAFTLDVSLPISLLPGETATPHVSLFPNAAMRDLADADGVLTDVLQIHAEQPSVGDVAVPMRATFNLAPVAVAVEMTTRRSTLKTPVGRPIIADGSETADPEGDAFTYVWSLSERPADSIAVLIGQGAATTRVTPDLVGQFTVTLRAIDVFGAFRDAPLVLLPRDLSVVLTWDTNGSADCRAFSDAQCAALPLDEQQAQCCGQSDLDLHLLRPGGALGDYGVCPVGCSGADCAEVGDEHAATCRQTGTDCAYANRAPDWAAAGRVDDPRLDLDDVRGHGPEITSLDQPEDGSYRVLVHYCEDRIGEPSLATVSVYDEGELVAQTAPQAITQGQAWLAATLVRSNGMWTVVAPPGIFESDVPAGLCGL